MYAILDMNLDLIEIFYIITITIILSKNIIYIIYTILSFLTRPLAAGVR